METLEDRRLLAVIEYLSGSVSGNTSASSVLPSANDSDVISMTDENNYSAFADAFGVGSARAFVSTDGSSAAGDEVTFDVYSEAIANAVGSSRNTSFNIQTSAPIIYEVKSTHPNEQMGDRVRLEIDTSAGASVDTDRGSGNVSFSVDISVGGSTVRSTSNSGSFLYNPGVLELEAAIGDTIEVTVSFTGSTAATHSDDMGASALVRGGFNLSVDLIPTVDLDFPSPGEFNSVTNTFAFPYRVLHEDAPVAAEIAFYWAQDSQFGYDPFDPNPTSTVFDPALTCGSATLSNYVMENTTVGTHMASIPLSDFTAAPPDAEGLQLVMDPGDVVAEYFEEDLGFVNFRPASIGGFTHAAGDDVDRLAISYESTPGELGAGFVINFVSVPDMNYEAMGFDLTDEDDFLLILQSFQEPILYQVPVTPSAIAANPAVELEGESAALANFPSIHRLLIDPAGTPLETALLDPDNEAVVAIVDYGVGCSGVPNIQGAPFSGFYHNGSNDRAVVRTRFGTEDNVSISGTTVTVPNLLADNSTTFSGSPEDILIITSDRDDTVQAAAGTTVPLYVRTGPGSDAIVGGDGNDILNGSYGDDLRIDGGLGNDVVIGGAGRDGHMGGLNGGEGDDVVLGDGFSVTGADFDFIVQALKNFPSAVELPLNLTPIIGADEDVINGGTGNELIIGGDAKDIIDAEEGHAIIFGDDFQVTTHINLTTSDIWTELNFAVDFLASASLQGSGNDEIKSGSDSSSVVIGGAGNDTIEGGTGTLDLLFGNEGVDIIRGAVSDKLAMDGSNLIVGGVGNDMELRGGDGPNVIFGDDFNINANLDFDLNKLLEGNNISSVFKVSGANFELIGTGNDMIYGGNGPIDLLIGGDGMDDIFGEDGFNVAFGDDFSFASDTTEVLFDIAKDLFDLAKDLSTANPFTFVGNIVGLVTSVYDLFVGSEGNSGGGEDFYLGGKDTDIVFGGAGNDQILGEKRGTTVNGSDFLVGGNGNDTFVTGPNAEIETQGDNKLFDFAFGGQGDDIFYGSGDNDFLGSTLGDDTFFGGGRNDLIAGGDAGDRIFGQDGDDTLLGDGGNNLIAGGFGDDEVFAEADDDIVYGGPGMNTIDAGAGTNTIFASRLAGDFDNDSDVDGSDFLIWQRNAGLSVGATIDQGDIDANGSVDGVDLFLWSNLYGTSAPSAPASTATANEEPSSQLIDAAMAWDLAQEQSESSEPATTEGGDFNTQITLREASYSWLPSVSEFVASEFFASTETAETTEDDESSWLADELLERVFE